VTGFTAVEAKETLDVRYPIAGATDQVGFSVDGASEWAGVTRTNIGNWAAATTAIPSVKGNASTVLTEPVTQAGDVTHYAIFKGSGAQRTTWALLDDPRSVLVGDSLRFAANELMVQLEQTP